MSGTRDQKEITTADMIIVQEPCGHRSTGCVCKGVPSFRFLRQLKKLVTACGDQVVLAAAGTGSVHRQ